MLRPRFLSCVATLALAAAACSQKTDSSPAVTEKAAAAPGPAEAEAPEIMVPPGDGPVAKVNGLEIPRDAFNREFRQTLERYRRARHEVKPALRERLKDNIVRRLVDQQIIAQQAEKMGVGVAPDLLETRWQEHKKRYGSEEAFQAFLERAGTTVKDVRRSFDQNHLREAVFRRIGEAVTVSGEEAREFFEKNEARYTEPEMVRASHVLIRVAANATPELVTEKRELAKKVRAEARKKGADFPALAAKYGEDPTKDRGGDLGFFPRGRMVKAFEEAVWKLDQGQISPVVKTQFGFHVIKKTGHRKAAKKSFEEVNTQIERSLLARNRNAAIRESLEKWKSEADVEIFVKGDPNVIGAAYDHKPPGIVPLPDKGALEKSLQLDDKTRRELQDSKIRRAVPASEQ